MFDLQRLRLLASIVAFLALHNEIYAAPIELEVGDTLRVEFFFDKPFSLRPNSLQTYIQPVSFGNSFSYHQYSSLWNEDAQLGAGFGSGGGALSSLFRSSDSPIKGWNLADFSSIRNRSIHGAHEIQLLSGSAFRFNPGAPGSVNVIAGRDYIVREGVGGTIDVGSASVKSISVNGTNVWKAPTSTPINPRADPGLKIWARDFQQLFKDTSTFLTMAGDVAAFIDQKPIQDIALKRIFGYAAEKIVEITTDNAADDVTLEMYKQLNQLSALMSYGTAPASATVAGAKFINKGFILGLDLIVDDPPRGDYYQVHSLKSSFDPAAWGGIFSDPDLSSTHLDMVSHLADMADGTFAMLLAAERAWGASLDGAADALALQNDAYSNAAAKTNAALELFRQSAGNLALLDPDPQALAALTSIGWDVLSEQDVAVLRQYFRSSGLFDDALIDLAFTAAYENDALSVGAAVFDEFSVFSKRLTALGSAPTALISSPVPEPQTFAMLMIGLGVLAAFKLRQADRAVLAKERARYGSECTTTARKGLGDTLRRGSTSRSLRSLAMVSVAARQASATGPSECRQTAGHSE